MGIWDTEGGNEIIPEPILLHDFEFSAGFLTLPNDTQGFPYLYLYKQTFLLGKLSYSTYTNEP